MFLKKEEIVDKQTEKNSRVAVLNLAGKRSDQWSLMLVSVGENAIVRLLRNFSNILPLT